MRLPALILFVVAATPLMAPAGPQDKDNPPAKDKAEESAKKIKELQKERIDTLKKQVDVLNVLVPLPRARGDLFGEAGEATMLLLRAELEVTEKGADRLTLYRKAIAKLKQYEGVAKKWGVDTRVPETTVLGIKSRRLEVEIELEKENARERKEGPQDKDNAQPKGEAEEPAKRIKELRKERIETLKEAVDHAVTAFTKGSVGVRGYEEVLEAQVLLLQAQLAATEKESERITLYQRTIETLKQHEKVAETLVKGGRATQAAVLKIKARRLEVEIQLEKEKAKERK
jgi:hypothetical protein